MVNLEETIILKTFSISYMNPNMQGPILWG